MFLNMGGLTERTHRRLPGYIGTCHTRRQRNMAHLRPLRPSTHRQSFQCPNQWCPRSQSLNRQSMKRKATIVQRRPVSHHRNGALQARCPPLYLDNTPWHRHRDTSRIPPIQTCSPSPGRYPPNAFSHHTNRHLSPLAPVTIRLQARPLSRHKESFPAPSPISPRWRRMRRGQVRTRRR